jgi:hypothetical protein
MKFELTPEAIAKRTASHADTLSSIGIRDGQHHLKSGHADRSGPSAGLSFVPRRPLSRQVLLGFRVREYWPITGFTVFVLSIERRTTTSCPN